MRANGVTTELDPKINSLTDETINLSAALLKNKRETEDKALKLNTTPGSENVLANLMSRKSELEKTLKEQEGKLKVWNTIKSATGHNQQWLTQLAQEVVDNKDKPLLRDIAEEKYELVHNNYKLDPEKSRAMVIPYNNSMGQVSTVLEAASQPRIDATRVREIKKKLDMPIEDVFDISFLSSPEIDADDREVLKQELNAQLWKGKNINPTFLNQASDLRRKLNASNLLEERDKLAYFVATGTGMEKIPAIEEDGTIIEPEKPAPFETKMDEIWKIVGEEGGNRPEFNKLMAFLMAEQSEPLLTSWRFNELDPEAKEQKIKELLKAGELDTVMTVLLNTMAFQKHFKWSDTNNKSIPKYKDYINALKRNE